MISSRAMGHQNSGYDAARFRNLETGLCDWGGGNLCSMTVNYTVSKLKQPATNPTYTLHICVCVYIYIIWLESPSWPRPSPCRRLEITFRHTTFRKTLPDE